MTNDTKEIVERHYAELQTQVDALYAEREQQAERIERLEKENFALAADQCHGGYAGEHGHHRCRELDKQAERIGELEGALKPFSRMAAEYEHEPPATEERVSICVVGLGSASVRITIGDLRRAVAALAHHDGEKP